MYSILFKIGPIPVLAYGFLIALAFLVAILASLYYAKREGIKGEIILEVAIFVIIASILGARLFYIVIHFGHYKDNLLEIFMVQRGGLIFLGGFFSAIIVVVWYTKMKGIHLLKLLDVLAPGTALGYSITRIGCFLNGCCFGLPTHFPWGIAFPPGVPAYSYFPEQPIHPTQLYSFASMVFIFFIIAFMYKRKKFDGHIFYSWIFLYSIYRFIVEFFRYNPFYWFGLSLSQWIVFIAAILVSWRLIYTTSRMKRIM